MPYCEYCGVEGAGDYCPACGEVRSFAAKAVASGEAHSRRQPQQQMVPVPPPGAVVAAQNNHGVPALLSFFFPGLGQLVKGHVMKGLFTWGAMSFAFATGIAIKITFLALPALWLWSVYDAYRSNSPKLGAD